jgi:hypothetical protein
MEHEARVPIAKRDAASWVNWQSALYALVLGWTCLVLVPLTSFWWVVPVLGAVVPVMLAVLQKPDLALGRPDYRKAKEKKLLEALAARGELAPTTAAMRTSLTVDEEASKMLEEFARKGHLRPRAEDGLVSYSLREGDLRDTPEKVPLFPGEGGGSDARLLRIEEPLSGRETEVLGLLASRKPTLRSPGTSSSPWARSSPTRATSTVSSTPETALRL